MIWNCSVCGKAKCDPNKPPCVTLRAPVVRPSLVANRPKTLGEDVSLRNQRRFTDPWPEWHEAGRPSLKRCYEIGLLHSK